VSNKKRALIVSDGAESINLIVRSIANELGDHGSGNQGSLNFDVKTFTAQEFDGTSLLAADIFFIGCEKPNPSSFDYLGRMLAHINLAARKCGIFSTDDNALNYLVDLVKDSEAELEKLLLSEHNTDGSEVKELVNKIKTGL